jgi:hypothetical protein
VVTVVESEQGELFPNMRGAKDSHKQESKSKPESKSNGWRRRAKPALIKEVSASAIEQVFDYWKTTLGKRDNVVLSELRKAYIAEGIKEYGIAACLEAIRGCSLSDFHMGDNRQNVQYNDIELILRPGKIENFREIDESFNDGGGKEPF